MVWEGLLMMSGINYLDMKKAVSQKFKNIWSPLPFDVGNYPFHSNYDSGKDYVNKALREVSETIVNLYSNHRDSNTEIAVPEDLTIGINYFLDNKSESRKLAFGAVDVMVKTAKNMNIYKSSGRAI
ncbi:MAG: hypothetical protein R3D71_09505 [Rickettsiales bacterium]